MARYRLMPEPSPLSWQAHLLILAVWVLLALVVIGWLALLFWLGSMAGMWLGELAGW